MTTGPLYAMGGAHPNALSRNDAMKGLATGNREGKSAEREQQIYTPQSIIDVCLATWPDGIVLDPCSGPGSIVPATRVYNEQDNGLTRPWVNACYFNPPYKNLQEWLEKSTEENGKAVAHLYDSEVYPDAGAFEQIGLFPVRPNRVWWSEHMSTVPTVVGWLKPLKFVGFKSGFPAPLVLIYTGANTDASREAVRPLSTYVGGRLV